MLGVRNQLTELANKNDDIYGIFLSSIQSENNPGHI